MAEDLEKLAENPEAGVSAGLPAWELARAYVLPQRYQKVLSPQEGLRKGTIFQELIRPYKQERPGPDAQVPGRGDDNE
ncbi:MAG: spore coat associated protein CotJA [Firmicutes bacterium]|jgi:hypothetical protein|nr:spore coat associated protein CotJA [Bacillota bacterium]